MSSLLPHTIGDLAESLDYGTPSELRQKTLTFAQIYDTAKFAVLKRGVRVYGTDSGKCRVIPAMEILPLLKRMRERQIGNGWNRWYILVMRLARCKKSGRVTVFGGKVPWISERDWVWLKLMTR